MRRLRVALETQFALGTPTGLGVYARRLATALAARSDIDVIELRDPRFDVWRFDRRVFWDQVRAPRLAAAAAADVVHFTGGTLPLRPPRPCVLTIHDMAWLDEAVGGRFHSRLYFRTIQGHFARQADLIATNTDVVREHIIRALNLPPSRVVRCGCGVDDSWFEVPRTQAPQPYFLCVGTVEERKDLVTAVRAISLLEGVRMISAGPHTGYATEVRRAAQAAGVEGRVELLGFIDDGALRSLYGGAAALVFPSRYEGFGLPPLQALAAGLPVIASDVPVLREVLGDCALFARPGDASMFAELMRAVLAGGAQISQRVERGRTHARGLTWAAVAERTVGLYRLLTGVGSPEAALEHQKEKPVKAF